jgi:hypothetical protein
MANPHHQGMHAHGGEPAYSIRRPASSSLHGHAQHSSAPPPSGVGQSQLPHVRDRITFPSTTHQGTQHAQDHDWDIPTFQRRSGGNS